MESQQPQRYPRVVPMIAYEDGPAALDFLCRAFGFRERFRMANEDGSIGHAELEIGDGLIMLATPTADYHAPKRHRETCDAARTWASVPWVIDGVYVEVDDVDAHHETARAAGATILTPPRDEGHGKQYRAEDLEGHRWMFAERSG